MNDLKKKRPTTVWGLKKQIIRNMNAAGPLTENVMPSLRRLLMSLTSNELKRFHALVSGSNSTEHAVAMSKVVFWQSGDEKLRALKTYLAFHGLLLGMKENYKRDSAPDEIIRWLAYCGISMAASVKEPWRFAALLYLLKNMRKGTEYSAVTHTTDLGKTGILRWVFHNPDQVGKVLEACTKQNDYEVSPGMVEAFYNEQPSSDQLVDGWEARTYIYSSVNGSDEEDKTADIISELSDEEAMSIYWTLVGEDGYTAHEFLRDVFSHEHDDEVILNFLQAYACSSEPLQLASALCSPSSTVYEQVRWLFYYGLLPDDRAGFRAAVEVAAKITFPWLSASSTRIGSLSERGLLSTAYARPEEVERLVEIFQNDPDRHYFSPELLESHNALTDGVL